MAGLNGGPWLGLEGAVRDAAHALEVVYVVTGPLYDPHENQLRLPHANEDHSVPTGYFKVIADKSAQRVAAFVFDQDATGDYCTGSATLAEVEAKSGLEIFPGRPAGAGWRNLPIGCRDD